MRLSIPQNN